MSNMTNGDKIRTMTDEELAEIFTKQCAERLCLLTDCLRCWLDWLKEEARE